jgi:hypothetical protein
MITRLDLILALNCLLCITTAANAQPLLINIDFGDLPPASGVLPDSASSHPAFSAARVWNTPSLVALEIVSDPFYSNLLDNDGQPTNVGLQFHGDLSFWSFQDANYPVSTDFLFFNNRGLSEAVSFEFTGLPPHGTFAIFAFGTSADFVREFDLVFDTDADGSFDDEFAKRVGAEFQTPIHALFTSVSSDVSGTIRGLGQGIGPQSFTTEANLAGLQIVQVPEASSLLSTLIGGGLISVVVRARGDDYW